ncbi:MAG TPA: hypothetical protein VFM13_03425 [Gaiellaceae bacterium]|nr:hypothetical protein [Gaiellaceae bacterium]
MDRTNTPRPIPLVLVGLVALLSALAALAVSGGGDAGAHGPGHAKADISVEELSLRNDMRKLWEDHVTWTRLAIISLTTGSPDTDATVGRLLRNQDDIGDAVAAFYGRAAGDRLSTLLREHITIAAQLVVAAKAGDQAEVAKQQALWEENADAIARFLSDANPHWRLNEMREMLHEHLSLTTSEAVARLQGDWAADVAAYDQIHVQALEMADMLSTGIVAQFPRRFR